VLADRDGLWNGLKAKRDAIRQRARRAHRKQRARTVAALNDWFSKA
jgi:hypothetical protein